MAEMESAGGSGGSLGVGVLVSWLLMPAPTFPLTLDDQIALASTGRHLYEYVWPKLPAEDKADWEQIQKR